MNKTVVFILIGLFASAASNGFAQSPYQNLAAMSALSNGSTALKLVIEMTLLYKLLGQPSMVASSDGGIIVLFGNKLSKYDKDLNLVKEIHLDLNVSGMQELVSKVAESYSKEIMSTTGGLTGNLLNAKMSSNDALAKATLRAISTAAESYGTANNGNYPSSVADLTLAKPPYLNTDYCEREISGYYYSCEFKATGYKITATPSKRGETGSASYSITTGGVLTP